MSDLEASQEDPYTWEIARIRRAGELEALRREILQLQHYFNNDAWADTQSSRHFKKLGIAITKAESQLKRMRMLLNAMRALDENND